MNKWIKCEIVVTDLFSEKESPDCIVKQIVFDFCDADANSYDENVGSLLRELDIGVLGIMLYLYICSN